MKKQFAVIGMGRFGSSVARTLCDLGFEVLAIERSEEKMEDVVDLVTHVVQADSTDEEAMRSLGIRNFDVVVVAIGQDIQSSILTTIILKELGVPTVVVKAQNELHAKVVRKVGADKVIFPERDMGMRVAHHLISPNIIDYIELTDGYSILEVAATGPLRGRNLRELDIRAKYRCNVIAIKAGGKMNITPHAEDLITEHDVLVVVGRNSDLQNFEKAYSG
jgi:trk system potassium uptake protein TrkA